MARCPGCGLFASYEGDEEPEVEDLTFDPAASAITGSVRCVKRSACCGEEIKETTFDLELEVSEDLAFALSTYGVNPEDERIDWQVEDDGFSATELVKTTDKKGKPIKSPRYWQTFYGYEGHVRLVAVLPEQQGTVEIGSFSASDETPASSFEDLT